MSILRHKGTIITLVVIVIACCFWILPTSKWLGADDVENGIGKREDNAVTYRRSTQRNDKSRGNTARNNPKASIVERMKEARGAPDKLVALFSEAEKAGLFEDAEWRNCYLGIMNRFSPEQIGLIYAAMTKPMTHTHFVANCSVNWAEDVNNPSKRQRVYDILNAIPDMNSRSELLRGIFKRSELLSPSHFSKTLSSIERVDYSAIGSAIRMQMKRLSDAEFNAAAEKYFRLTEHPSIVRPMAAELVARLVVKDTDAAKKWLLEAPPHLASSGDQKLMAIWGQKDIAKGVDFIDELLSRKEHQRASTAVTSLGTSYARKHPEEALNWAIALPDFVTSQSRQQVIHTALYALSRKDIQRVRDLAAANKDPELKWLYNIAIKRHNDK